MERLCKRGHLITDQNFYLNGKHRVCKKCAIDRAKAARPNKRLPVKDDLIAKSLKVESGCIKKIWT